MQQSVWHALLLKQVEYRHFTFSNLFIHIHFDNQHDENCLHSLYDYIWLVGMSEWLLLTSIIFPPFDFVSTLYFPFSFSDTFYNSRIQAIQEGLKKTIFP